jgi:hypothetical protein
MEILAYLTSHMYRFAIRTLAASLCLMAIPALSQESRVIRVGVAVMQNKAGRSVPGNMERDRLVAALNQEKPDKKQHIKLQGVPLEGMTPDDAGDEAAQKKCDYVVYTSLIALRSSTDPTMPPRAGTGSIQTNPGGAWSTPGSHTPGGQETGAMNPEYSATVDFRLYRTGSPNPIAGVPFSNRQAGDEESVVSQVMDLIANKVYAEIKKVPAAMQE